MRYRQVVRAEHRSPEDYQFIVPLGVRVRESEGERAWGEHEQINGANWGVKWGCLTIKGVEEAIENSVNDDPEQFKWPIYTEINLIDEGHELWDDLVEKGEQYDIDPDYDHEAKPDGEPKFECFGCGEPCQVQTVCECGGDFCENCKCSNCEVNLFCLAQSNSPFFH
jgi:hypothetical protein